MHRDSPFDISTEENQHSSEITDRTAAAAARGGATAHFARSP
jgi:hypothetical protein